MTKIYCGICDCMTMRTNKEEEDKCPYHQEVMHDEDGGAFLRYEEFDQNGE
jgi:hypothetical protein|tara:strand:+ start:791 stop:943 length:153 start_codon:yes stop_codon:yes gene_type:complete